MPYISGWIGCTNSSSSGGSGVATNWEVEELPFNGGFAENDTIDLSHAPIAGKAIWLFAGNGPLAIGTDYSIANNVITMLYSDPGPIVITAQYEYQL